MEQPIIIRYRWTADDLYDASCYHFRHRCRPVFRLGLHFLFGVLIVGAVFMFIEEYRTGDGTFMPAIALLTVGVYWFAFRPFHVRWMVRRRFRKRPDRDIEIEWRATDDQMELRCTLAHSEVAWPLFTKMVWTSRGVMLYPNEDVYHWLPRRGFESDSEYGRFLNLAKSKIPRYYNVA